MSTFAFSGGLYAAQPFGSRKKIRFVNTWAVTDDWTVALTALLTGAATIGKGNIAEQTYTSTIKLRNRMFLSFSNKFAMSSNSDATKWEEQDSGAAVISYTSQYGQQDTVQAFATMQGRLAVFGKFSIQVWQPDADPANFALQQVLDQAGTIATKSVRSVGDLDVFYLDRSGIRSLRSKEQLLNAYVDDIGTPVDLLVRADLIQVGANYVDNSGACAIVEPSTKQYWLYLNSKIYCLSRYNASKISAWSTFDTRYQAVVTPNAASYDGSGNVTYTIFANEPHYWVAGSGETSFVFGTNSFTSSNGFITAGGGTATVVGVPLAAVTGTLYRQGLWGPEHFISHQGRVYAFSENKEVILYGGSDNATYDHIPLVAELPWLDLKDSSANKHFAALDLVMKGNWKIEVGTTPNSTVLREVINRGSKTAPLTISDATYDKGRFPINGNGTRIKIKATSYNDSATVLSKIAVIHQTENKK